MDVAELFRRARGLDVNDLSWQSEAVCSQTDPELFFPELEKQGAIAKRICQNCPVQVECFNYAVTKKEENGIYAGIDFTVRKTPTKVTDSYRFDGEDSQTVFVTTSEFLRLTRQKHTPKVRGRTLESDYGH
jgi:WhiB family redox-sensing transcriptional regulator